MNDIIMVRYGELSLKGKNKRVFIDTLSNNIHNSLRDIKGLTFNKQHDRFYINLNGSNDVDTIIKRLSFISGIHNFSFVSKCEKNIDEIVKTAYELMKDYKDITFKVLTSRSDKEFPLISDEINRKVASYILKNTNLKVDVHNPSIPLKVEIRKDACYITTNAYQGLGGLPLGSSGSGLLMISGGIDSPVAGFMMLKRGIRIKAIHFSAPPYTSEMAIYKVKTLLSKLNFIQSEIVFLNVPFTELQLEIYKQCKDEYAITIMRRMMYRIASRFMSKEKCLCLVNGESIGQVASQTLESMKVINEVTNVPIIRPLAIFDKEEIIKIARNIDTYETSILPYEDCCTIFDPKNPVTKPHLDRCHELEAKWDFEKMIEDAITNTERIVIKSDD